MIDLKSLNDNLERIKKSVSERGILADPDRVVSLYERKKELIINLDVLRNKRKINAKMIEIWNLDPTQFLGHLDLEKFGRKIKTDIASIEQELTSIEQELTKESMKLPNYAHPLCPPGKNDEDNQEIKKVGTPPDFKFELKNHLQIAKNLDLVDFEKAVHVSGPRFYFLKNEAVFLEWALVRYAMDILLKKGFTLYQTPDIAKDSIAQGLGFLPRGPESNIYTLEGTETSLIGTAEITLGGYYADQILDLSCGAILMGGVSHCFRREAGSSGFNDKGLYRVHQFTKVEMFVLCTSEESEIWHQKVLEIEEEIFSGLGLAYRVVDVCLGSLGAPAYRKYDIEVWMPAHKPGGSYQEITSTSNCTDFQARRLKIRYKDAQGKAHFAHTLNGTAIAVSRALVAIFENYQQPDGSLRLPKALYPYLNFKTIPSK